MDSSMIRNFGYRPDSSATEKFTSSIPSVYNAQLEDLKGDPNKPSLLYKVLAKALKGSPYLRNGRLASLNQLQVGSCFEAGVRVTMSDGSYKNVEDVEIGDQVITHEGRVRQVIDTMSRSYSGDMVEITLRKHPPLRMTADHKVLVYRKGERLWVEAKDVLSTDELYLAKGIEEPVRYLNLSDYLSGDIYEYDGEIRVSNSALKKWIKNKIPLSDELCWSLGLYCSEGSTDRTDIGPVRAIFSLNTHERDLQERLKKYFNSLGVDVSFQQEKDSDCLNVRLNCPVMARFFESVCGRYCNHKKVPSFILKASKQQKRCFLLGCFQGDGHFRFQQKAKKLNKHQIQSSTVQTRKQVSMGVSSNTLTSQCHTLCLDLGYTPSRTFQRSHVAKHDGIERKARYNLYLYSEDACDFAGLPYDTSTWSENAKVRVRTRMENQKSRNEGHLQRRKVTGMDKSPVENLRVYDFTVDEDHSFVAEGVVVHNCVGFGTAGGADLTAAGDIYIRGEAEQWPTDPVTGKPLRAAPDWHYAASRTAVGDFSRGDGSYGSAAAKSVQMYGNILQRKYDKYDLSSYSESKCREWTRQPGVPQELISLSQKNSFKAVVNVQTCEHLVALLQNGYGVNMCSMLGFNGPRDEDGFCKVNTRWAHSMYIAGYVVYKLRNGRYKRGFIIVNSWGSGWKSVDNGGGPLGKLTPDLPWGAFIAYWDDIQRALSGGDTYAYGSYKGFVPPPAPWERGLIL